MKKNIVWTIVALFVILVNPLCVSAQEKVVVTPLFESGTYTTVYPELNPSSGYESTGRTSTMIQKGFAAEIKGDGRWATKFRFTIGDVDTPISHYRLTDGRYYAEPYMEASNAVTDFAGGSRSFEMTQEYSRGVITYRFGVGVRLFEYTDKTHIAWPDPSYSESEFTDTYISPRIGLTARKQYGRFAAIALFDASPWIHHSGSYEFRLRGSDSYRSEAATTSKGMDLDMGGTFRIMKNLGIAAGWRYSSIYTKDGSFVTPNPYGSRLPRKNSWNVFYLGARIVG